MPAAYLSLKDGIFLTTKGNGFPGAWPVGEFSLDATWNKLVSTIKFIMKEQFGKKRIRAAGIPDESDASADQSLDRIALEPPCSYCDYSVLCGKNWTGKGGEQ